MKLRIFCVLALLGSGAAAWADETATDPVAAGKALVIKTKCSMCHVVEGKGGKTGKPMDTFAEKTEEQLTAAIVDPKTAIAPDTKMPSYKTKLTADEIKSVVAYIKSLKK